MPKKNKKQFDMDTMRWYCENDFSVLQHIKMSQCNKVQKKRKIVCYSTLKRNKCTTSKEKL